MKTNSRAQHIRSWSDGLSSIVLTVSVLAIAMTVGICSAAEPIFVQCALPYAHGHSDPSCVGQNIVEISTSNTDANAVVTAELLGLDVNGNLISSFNVKNGQQVQLGSRLSQADWKFIQNKNLIEVFAPVPLLHVKVQDQGQTADAFCSNIPYMQVIQPAGNVVTESGGNNTNVLAAAPLTDPSHLHLFVDGVDLLPQVPAPGYLACTPAAPCSGTATINGNPVNYSNLIVDIASNVSSPSSNTVRVTLSDLTCGGHNFNVSSAQSPSFPSHVSAACDVDSLSKTGTSSVFEISITSPTTNQVIPVVPTPVTGQVCSGTQIADVNINGQDLGNAGETFTAGNGTTTGNVYIVPINTTLGQTDLVRSAFGDHNQPLGTFDAGTNRLAASAMDVLGNRTYQNVIFATGSVAPVAIDPSAVVLQEAAMRSAVNSHLEKLVRARIAGALDSPTNTDLPNAFVVGLSASGTQTEYNKLCNSPVQSSDPTVNGLTPGQIFSQKVTASINATPLPTAQVSTACTCTAPVPITIKSVNVGTDVTCNLTFNNGSFHVTMDLPAVQVVADAAGWCEEDFAGVCVDQLAVNIEETATITGIQLNFDVTEANLLNNTTATPTITTPSPTTSTQNLPTHYGGSGFEEGCLSSVCNVVLDIFTLGLVNLSPSIDLSSVQDFSGQIGVSRPDPVKLHQITVDPTVVADFNQKESGDITEVHITPSGITAGLVGHFASLAVDPNLPPTPGITLTPAPVPTLPVAGAQDVFIGISDDAINMMFASLTAAGRLQTGTAGGSSCVDAGIKVGDILPSAGCDSLTLSSDSSTVAARSLCHAIKGDSCGTLSFNDPANSATANANLTATEQGACYGAQGLPAGQTCSSLSQSVTTTAGKLLFVAACNATPNYNLNANQPLLFCAQGDVPPRMLFPDSAGSPSAVPAVLRIPSLSVSLIADRQGIGPAAQGPVASIPGCFTQGTSNAVDCNVFQACYGLNIDFTMAYETCSQDGKPGFLPTFQDVQVLNSQIGTVCGGATSPTTDTNVLQQGSNQGITIPLGKNGANFAPPICGAGLDLGGFVTCSNPGLLSIRSESTFTDSRDYLAITCAVH